MKVLSVASEVYPLVKTGGLADVAGALPAALAGHGVEVVTLVPGYPAVMAALRDATAVHVMADSVGGPARLLFGHAAGLRLLVLEAPQLFERPGNPYAGPDGRDWPDNALRFGALGFMAAQVGLHAVAAFRPDIVHGHDWQAGLTMAYLAYSGRPHAGTVLTVHNLAFTGQVPAELLGALRLPPHAYAIQGVEFYGAIGFLKAGVQFADRLTTVSPTYAREIQTPDWGCGLDGLFRERAGDLSGILNGIDTTVWDPARDPRIAARYDRSQVAGRRPNKVALQARFGLASAPDRLLFGMVGRFTWQKGVDVLADAVPALLEAGGSLVLLGTGEPALEQRLLALAREHPDRIGCQIGYDEDLAHLIQAGSDVLLVPSRFEPCGLTQLCALRYGGIPLVADVGGLADTVVDLDQAAGRSGAVPTGLKFSPVTSGALAAGLRRVAALWQDRPAWEAVQANGMAVDVSWSQSAARYAALYQSLRVGKK